MAVAGHKASTKEASMRRFVAAIVLALWPALASAQITQSQVQAAITNLPQGGNVSVANLQATLTLMNQSVFQTGLNTFVITNTPTIGYGLVATSSSMASWTAQSPVNPVWWGADPTGVADSTAAFNSALAASNFVRFPPGKFKLSSRITYTIPSSNGSVTIEGAGAEVTQLNWTSGAGGLSFVLANITSSFHVRNLTLTVATTAGGNAILATQTLGSGDPAVSSTSDITNVTFRGSDGPAQTNYWSNAINLIGVSNVNIFGVSVYGANTFGGLGAGVLINGLTGASQYAVATQISNSQFNQLQFGVVLGSFWQGLSIFQSQFTGGQFGVIGLPSQTGSLDQVIIDGSQFNIQGPSCGTGNGCYALALLTQTSDVYFHNNLSFASSASAGIVEIGDSSARCIISGNTLISASTTQIGISFPTGTTNDCIITDNTFIGAWSVGILINTATSDRIIISDNNLLQPTTPIINNSTAQRNKIVNNIGFNPVGYTAGTSTGTSASVITASASPETHYITQSATFNAVVAKCTTAACGTSTNICTVPSATVPCVLSLGPNESYKVTWATTQPTYTKDVH
jgi:hypothetical protein